MSDLRTRLDRLDVLESCVPEGYHPWLKDLREHLIRENTEYLVRTGQTGEPLYRDEEWA